MYEIQTNFFGRFRISEWQHNRKSLIYVNDRRTNKKYTFEDVCGIFEIHKEATGSYEGALKLV